MKCLPKCCHVLASILGLALAWPAAAAEEHEFRAGDLRLTLERGAEGVKLLRLVDETINEDLLASSPAPLFRFTLRGPGLTNEFALAADQGWRDCLIQAGSRRLKLEWKEPTNAALRGISAELIGTADRKISAIDWQLRIANRNTNWGVWRVVFPELTLRELGSNAAVLFPRGPGEVQRGVWNRPFTYRGNYPDGWCSMQFMAAYRDGGASGLYVGMHDPRGSTKTINAGSDPASRAVTMSYDHPVPDMGKPETGFALEGKAVWQLFRGDWFDAARIYRAWAQAEAKWWPRLGRDGRTDTPRWMRDLNVWAMTGGAPADCLPRLKKFRELLGEPVGFHWYNWHQIPFDNDYPHYFPTKPGFVEAVNELKSAGVFVMPYINGRLWDSHDRGAEDFAFTRLALPAVTRKEDGSPFLESYGSKETNGQPVRLGVMCPSTVLWQNTVSNIVLRLLRECGTSSVYIDQVAAAAPALCMEPAHGHPLGGGPWWCESYWKMLEAINRARPGNTMLTTECNSEPFIRWFDGYLTWHWQHDGQVPAFPAVYGGAIQMFGRAYRGGATRDLALRMKAAQQLVYGEQLGWLGPEMLDQKENAEFFGRLARLRASCNRYFVAGEMARPPSLEGPVPTVKADWQWSGEWWVTTDAVLTGAWQLRRERRAVLLFVNVSDEPVTAAVRSEFAALPNATGQSKLELTYSTSETGAPPPKLGLSITFPPRHAQAWEMRW